MVEGKRSRRCHKAEPACREIEKLAQKLGPAQKLPTVVELCETLGVSRGTLDQALTMLEKKRVLYRVHGSGIFVAPEALKSLLLIYTYPPAPPRSPFWDLLIENLRNCAAADNLALDEFGILPCPRGLWMTNPLPDATCRAIEDGRFDGALLVHQSEIVFDFLQARGIPSVSYAGWGDFTVGEVSNVFIGEAIQDLYRQGCRRIGLWRPSPSSESLEACIRNVDAEAYHIAHEAMGMACDEELAVGLRHFIPKLLGSGESWLEMGYAIACHVFGGDAARRPDGVVITDDMMTRGALDALRELDIVVGRDVKIATHGVVGSPLLEPERDDMTVFETDPHRIARAMLSVLETQMSGEIPVANQMQLRLIKRHKR